MSAFLDTALDLASRGWYVFPCWPRTKKPMTAHGWKDATLDAETITAWWTKTPDANMAIACAPSDLAVMDIDHGLADDNAALLWLGAHKMPATYMVRTGRRPEYGLQIYFRGAIPDVGLWQLDGCEGQIKSLGGYVMAAGSIHPDSGQAYTVKSNETLADTPDAVRALRSFQLPIMQSGPMQKIPEGSGRHAALTSVAGTFRSKGFDEDAVLMQLIPANEAMCEVPVSHEDLEHIAQSVCRYPVAAHTPEVTIGGKKASAVAVTEDVEEVEELDPSLRATPLPTYPLFVFEGTLYMDFAKRAAEGNFVPLEFFIEGAMTYAGAMAADNLHGMSDVITPRLYTVLLAMAGLGKGTTFRRLRHLVPPNRMLDAVTDSTAIHSSSSMALLARAGSEPALNDALLACNRVCLDFEEMDRMMEKTRIEGSGGALMSVIRTLFDDTHPGITTTSQRKIVAPIGYLSLLGAMTPSLWRQSMEGRDSYGSGLGGRFNLVATNVNETAATLRTMNAGDLQSTLDKKLADLERSALTIPTESAACDVLDEWWEQSKGRPHYNRVNVITHRKALHLAWMHGVPVITREIMLDAVRLADYLVGVRDAFAVTKGEDRTAIGENRVMHILKQISPKWVGSKKVVELLDGLMSRASVFRALEALVGSGEAEKQTIQQQGLRRYGVYRASLT